MQCEIYTFVGSLGTEIFLKNIFNFYLVQMGGSFARVVFFFKDVRTEKLTKILCLAPEYNRRSQKVEAL